MAITPAEAYKSSFDNGIAYIERLIQEHANRGLVTMKLERVSRMCPEVIAHFKKLGYKFHDNGLEDTMSWADAGFNQ